MKLLKVWDTGLKMWSKIKQFALSIYVLFFIIVIIISVFFPPSVNLYMTITLLISFVGFFIIFSYARKKEISKVVNTIKDIRSNPHSDPDDIVLGNDLKDLESEIKIMYRKMNQDIEYLKRLERIRTEFLANVSHELRTPIFTIQGFLETLLDGAIDNSEVNIKFLRKALQHTIDLGVLVNDLIDISMIESGEMRLSFRYFNINNFITEIVNEMTPLAKEKNLDLVFIHGREKLQLLGDKTRLKQVMTNLVTNAIRYTDSGRVEIIVSEETEYAVITVKDTGIGIPDAEQKRIFERFYRIDKARSRAIGGTGLGLAIAKHIIEAHGTKIEVRSRLNEGSEFNFRLKK
ncbi:MAG: two-component sensor histidine kinase [Ignavibacteriales bacterium]|nr:MAG: two-component sensor histidine kinase [Ignavibacteriales bacterium]